MAAQNKLFQRLIWLIDTIYSAGEISRDEIDRRWAHSSYNDTHATEYGERNFHRHRETIFEMFGIEIACNRTTKTYFLANMGDSDDNGVRAWLIDTFAVNNMVNLAGDMQNRILFERIPEGARFLSTIVSAMKEGRLLLMTYKRFERQEAHSFRLTPYCLKVFKQRWYLIGKPEDHPEETAPRVYALDRVMEICATDQIGKMPKNFDPGTFFENQFGVDRRITETEYIKVKVKAAAANYIRTLPIHETQYETEQNDEYSIFTYHIAPTYDFIQELRKHGANLEVLEPAYLREAFRSEAAQLAHMYQVRFS